MATLDQLKALAEEQLGFEVEDTDILISSYMCHGMSQSEICDTLGVESGELKALVESEDFQSIRQVVQLEIARGKVDIDGGWDSAERAAIHSVNEYIDANPLDIDTALKIASVANKAERRGEKANQAIGGQQGGVVTISLKQTYVNAIQNGNQMKEVPSTPVQVLENDQEIEISVSAQGNESLEKENNKYNSPMDATSKGLNGLAMSVQPQLGELNEILNIESAVKNQGSEGGSLGEQVLEELDA